MTSRVLVAGLGNIFFGDDGFGAAVARELSAARLPDGVRVVDYGIRGMHLAYDLLDPVDTLVIVDTIPGPGEPGAVSVLQVGSDDLGEGEFDAHGMNPVAVLANLEHLGGQLPRTYVVGCVPGDLGEGMDLTAPVQDAVQRAVGVVNALLSDLLVVA